MNPQQLQSLGIDDDFLSTMGVNAASNDDKTKFLSALTEELELRVGTKIAEHLSDEQLKEFSELSESANQEEAAAWLAENFPAYQQVVVQQVAALKQEMLSKAQASGDDE